MATAEDEISLDLESVYPENVIKVGKITFGEKKDKIPEKTREEIREKIKKECPEKSNQEIDKEIKSRLKKKLEGQTVRLTRAACALLNSGGGVIRAEIENEGYSLVKDPLGLDMQSLMKCINHSEYSKYFDYKQEGSSILIFVKSWCSKNLSYPHVCSLSTGLYERADSSAMIRDPRNALDFLKGKKADAIQYSHTEGEPAEGEPAPKRACLPTSISSEVGMQRGGALPEAAAQFFEKCELKRDDILNFGESTTVEFKAFPENEDILKFVESKLPRYVSAFASTEGGLIIFGVDDQKKILGHRQKVEDEELGSIAKKTVMTLPYFHFCTSKEKVTYKCKTIPVYCNKARHSCILAVKIEPFCCVVFSDPPDSWAIKDDKPQRIEVREWCQLMTVEDPGPVLDKSIRVKFVLGGEKVNQSSRL